MRSKYWRKKLLFDHEKNELINYKKFLKDKLYLTTIFTIFLLAYFFFFPEEYFKIIYIIAGINIIIKILSIYLNQHLDKLKYLIISRNLFAFFMLIQFLLINNIPFILSSYWDNYFIFISLFIITVTFYIGKLKADYSKFNLLFRSFTFEKVNENYVFNALRMANSKQNSNKWRSIVPWVIILIPPFFYGVDTALSYFGLYVTYEYAIAASFFITGLLIKVTIINFALLLLIIKYEKENNTILYTALYKYILMEETINDWRRLWKSLEPVKINSIFFNGDITR